MMLNEKSIFLAAEGGALYRYNLTTATLTLVFKDEKNETLMGLEKKDDILYLGGKTRLFKFKMNNELTMLKTFTSPKGHTSFHQIMIIDDYLYVTVTHRNEVWKFDLDLSLCKVFKIAPPNSSSPVQYGKNYNHLNNIFYDGDNFYVCLNWLTQKQYGPSGVAVLDSEMKEVRRFEHGWETHNYLIFEDKEYVLCGSSGAIKKVNHPHKGGLMVDGKLVFEYDPNRVFCKDFSIDKDHIYIVGGSIKERGQRDVSDGVLFILDRNFEFEVEKVYPESGGLCGCLLVGCDFSKVGG